LDVIYKIAEDVEAVQIRCSVAHDEFREKFKPGLVEVVFEWAGGMVSPLHDLARARGTQHGRGWELT